MTAACICLERRFLIWPIPAVCERRILPQVLNLRRVPAGANLNQPGIKAPQRLEQIALNCSPTATLSLPHVTHSAQIGRGSCVRPDSPAPYEKRDTCAVRL